MSCDDELPDVLPNATNRNCPHCKTLRKATKNLSLSRLPPVLLIHLKRFSSKGHFTDKIETFVDYPIRSLDLTNYMPPPLPPGVDMGLQPSRDDPRAQVPPYRYDLYGVTNHFGTLSSGHCKRRTNHSLAVVIFTDVPCRYRVHIFPGRLAIL